MDLNMQTKIINEAARAAHESNRAYCEAIGDTSQVSWIEAEDWQQASARAGVRFILDSPEASPSDTHESWLEEKRRDGWKRGDVKDAEKKEHPCFVPYDDLPEAQKAKDAIFGAVVRGVIAHYQAK